FYSPLTRIWELLIGAILAYMFTHKKSLTYSHIFQFNKFEEKLSNISIQPILHLISTIGFILLIVGFISTDGEDYPGWLALIPVLGAALIISSGANAFVNKKILSSKVLVWFGLISYPLYLWHWPLLSFLNIIDGKSVSVEMRITLIAISIILSWLTYKFIENPVRLKGYLSIKFWIILNIVIFFVGVLSYKSDGFEFRSTIENHQNNKNELIRTPRMDDSCKQLLDLEKPNFEYCRFSKVNTDDIVALIGDSHAHVAFQGVSEYLIDYEKSTLLLASSGCPSFVLGKNVDVESNYLDCSVRARQIIDILKSRRDVTKVFIFARGPLYYTGWEPLDSVSKPSQDILIDQKHYFEAAQKTIDELVNSGKEVIFVTENPELPFDPKSCIPRPFRNKPSSCSLKKEVVLARLDGYLNSVNSLKNVKVFNSLEVFCPEGECLVFDSGGLLLYADDDHLSVNGSNFQAKKIISHIFNEK
ncbi:MAG: acyltransferase family protein, partial [Flavobacteriaceae bacterium]|nr:acyltransferase family protein [Flavobacteriaceae bacterium]